MQASLERLQERRREGHEGGFTLIELLIVIVILAILAAIVVFAVDSVTSTSAKASCQSDVSTVDHAVQTYIDQVGSAPASISVLESTATGSSGDTVGPWLHNTPTNGHHYNIVLTDGTTAALTGVPTLPTPAALSGGTKMWTDAGNAAPPTFPTSYSVAANQPKAGYIIVQNWTVTTGGTGWADNEIFVAPTNPTGVTGTLVNSVHDACVNAT